MNSSTKVVFLRLRNRVLNRFKALKKTAKIARQSKRIAKPNKKTLRVVPKPAIRTRSSPLSSPKSSPKSSPVKFGARTASALKGHRRMFLRNRRLMMTYIQRSVACF